MAFPPSAGFNFSTKTHTDTYKAISASNCNQLGRAVFITGASKGIGRATAVAFAQAGATAIAVAARSPLDEVAKAIVAAARAAGHEEPQVLQIELDVSDEQGVARAASEIEDAFGRLDILVNNAGRMEVWGPLADSDPSSWWRTWEVNVKGTYLVTRALLPLLLKGCQKTIVNVGSLGAHLTRPGASAYQTGKLALLRLTEFFNADYGAEGLLAFSIHPGAVATEMVMVNLPADSRFRLVDTPELAADSIVWLTQERRMWLAGRYLSASWDMPEIISRKDEIVEGNKLKVRLAL